MSEDLLQGPVTDFDDEPQAQPRTFIPAEPPAEPPPASAERALCCALLMDADRTLAQADEFNITVADMMDPLCRLVWSTALSMRDAGEDLDAIGIIERAQPDVTPDMGDRLAIDRLMDTSGVVPGIAYRYAAAVADASSKRRAARIARQIWDASAEGGRGSDLWNSLEAAVEEELARTKRAEKRAADIFSLIELSEQPIDHAETLIGYGPCRFLERGAVLMLAAPSGVGKSHVAAQAAACWSAGLPAFRLPTYDNRPLRCLIVQAENPPNDARHIAANMVKGIGFGPAQKELVAKNTRQAWLPGCTGDDFLARLRGILRAWPADIVFIDPLSGFASGDLVRPEVVQAFCRVGLGAIAVEHKCALFVCHHIPKPNAQRDAGRTGAYDWQYAGAGSADLVANWPRANLAIQALDRGEFMLRAAKRRPPWIDENEQQIWALGMRHTEGGIWETFEPKSGDENRAKTGGRPKSPGPDAHRSEIRSIAQEVGETTRNLLVAEVRSRLGIGKNQAYDAVSFCIEHGDLVTRKREGRGGGVVVSVPGQKKADEKDSQ